MKDPASLEGRRETSIDREKIGRPTARDPAEIGEANLTKPGRCDTQFRFPLLMSSSLVPQQQNPLYIYSVRPGFHKPCADDDFLPTPFLSSSCLPPCSWPDPHTTVSSASQRHDPLWSLQLIAVMRMLLRFLTLCN